MHRHGGPAVGQFSLVYEADAHILHYLVTSHDHRIKVYTIGQSEVSHSILGHYPPLLLVSAAVNLRGVTSSLQLTLID
jgi:hypothetical protein